MRCAFLEWLSPSPRRGQAGLTSCTMADYKTTTKLVESI